MPLDMERRTGCRHQEASECWSGAASHFNYRRDILTLLNGNDSYFNRGLHVITMRWGKVCALDVFEDSQEVARGLVAHAASGLKEADLADPRRPSSSESGTRSQLKGGAWSLKWLRGRQRRN
jgi:hypothetical protein